jgi:hypothetical protein
MNVLIPTRFRTYRARYVSRATKGMTLELTGASKQTLAFELTPKNPACTKSPLTCVLRVWLPDGRYTASVKMYDEAPVKNSIPPAAQLLSTARDMEFSIATRKTTHLPLTLTGIPDRLKIGPLPNAKAGTPFAKPQFFRVKAFDAANQLIVGPYERPVRLRDNDTSGATAIATSGDDHPQPHELLGSDDIATLSYTGLAIRPATITATSKGVTSYSRAFAPELQPITITTTDSLNPSYAGVDLYAPSGAGSTGSFTASEAGWTGAPYDKSLTVTTASGCSSIATLSASGTSYTATVAGSPVAGTCTATVSDPLGQSQLVTLAYTHFAYASGAQSLAVPAGVSQATITAAGGQGGSGCTCGGDVYGWSVGGGGGLVTATVGVSAEELSVLVGGVGGAGNGGSNAGGTGGTGGLSGGATSGGAGGGYPSGGQDGGGGGGGGGASSVLLAGVPLVTAGGGGGGGTDCDSVAGGPGGFPDGGPANAGSASGCPAPTAEGGGTGGTQTGDGTGGSGDSNGGNGASGAGGTGGTAPRPSVFSAGGGGGGGGYFGGGGGGSAASSLNASGGGGGGSSYYVSGATNVTTQSGEQAGNGYVTIVW